jgi:hypothetical protein
VAMGLAFGCATVLVTAAVLKAVGAVGVDSPAIAAESMTPGLSAGSGDASMRDVAVTVFNRTDGTGDATVLVLALVVATLLEPRAGVVLPAGSWRTTADSVSEGFEPDGSETDMGGVASVVGSGPPVSEVCWSGPTFSAADTFRFGAFGFAALGLSTVSLELDAPSVMPGPAVSSAVFVARAGLGVLAFFGFLVDCAPPVPDVDSAEVVWPDVEPVPVPSAQAIPGLVATAAPNASAKAILPTRPA